MDGRGLRIPCLEPGSTLAALARCNLASLARVEMANESSGAIRAHGATLGLRYEARLLLGLRPD